MGEEIFFDRSKRLVFVPSPACGREGRDEGLEGADE